MLKWWQSFLLKRRIRSLAESINYVEQCIRQDQYALLVLVREAHAAREALYWLEHGKVRDGTLATPVSRARLAGM